MVLSPWAVRNVRFDESLDPLHGYDFDYCLQLRAAGRKVVATDLAAIHHRPADLVLDPEEWVEAHMVAAEKWDGETVDWKDRARRAEAEAGVARLASASKLLQANARGRGADRGPQAGRGNGQLEGHRAAATAQCVSSSARRTSSRVNAGSPRRRPEMRCARPNARESSSIPSIVSRSFSRSSWNSMLTAR